MDSTSSQREYCKAGRAIGNARACVAAFLWTASLTWSDASGQTSVRVATDQQSYEIGEPIQITVSAVNGSDMPVILFFPTSAQATYVLGDYTPFLEPIQTATRVTIPANGSFDWRFDYDWSRPLSVGQHQVVGKVLDRNPNTNPDRLSPAITIDIVPEPAAILLMIVAVIALLCAAWFCRWRRGPIVA